MYLNLLYIWSELTVVEHLLCVVYSVFMHFNTILTKYFYIYTTHLSIFGSRTQCAHAEYADFLTTPSHSQRMHEVFRFETKVKF